MKKLVLSLTLLLAFASAFSQDKTKADEKPTAEVFEGSLIEATEKAAREKMGLLFVIWEDENDSLVQHYLQNVLTDPAVIQAFDKTIITIADSAKSETGVQLTELFGLGTFPVIQFYNVQGEDLYEFDSFIDPDQMIDILRRNVLNGSLK